MMVDGTGMCGSCRVTVGGKMKFACVDGPEFEAHHVDFPELLLRQLRFKQHEERAQRTTTNMSASSADALRPAEAELQEAAGLTPKQGHMPERNAAERAATSTRSTSATAMDDALAEAERCIQCKKPTCIAGCPVGIDIPRFIRHLLVRDLAARSRDTGGQHLPVDLRPGLPAGNAV